MDNEKTLPIKNNLFPILGRLEDFFIPPLCIVCDSPLESGLSGDRWFCKTCTGALLENHRTRNACPRCSQNRSKRECACESAWDFSFEKIFSIYDYDDTLSAVAQHIKYKGKSRLAYHIGVISAPLIPKDFFDGIEEDTIIPVPLHKARERSRGYNQAEHFARGLLKGLGKDITPSVGLLLRVKNTGTQTKLGKDARMKNLEGAFAAGHGAAHLKDKRITLIDDILTTGATAEACAEELLRAGCASVKVLSLGRD